MSDAYDAIVAGAAAAIRGRLAGLVPRIAIVLGSGLGDLVREITDVRSVAFADIPGFPAPTVEGHAGRLVAGKLGGSDVLALAGRFHMYEGHSADIAALPVRVAHALGVRTLFVSNAAGGVRRSFRPGDLMLIEDQINLMFRNPLIGPVRSGEERFPDMSAPFDRDLLQLLREAALAAGVPIVEGVYCGLTGPSYETPAEVRMLERLGADAVGMSTVPEVIVARALGMRVAGVSCITNMAAGITGAVLGHREVIETADRVKVSFIALVKEWAARVP
ncbi:MAG: purine-nucleoside phosphorylase [Gemmatimonadota bacterium]|nr:purine-nucleoside phosphorylase [Gemmatimonadota bacterium]